MWIPKISLSFLILAQYYPKFSELKKYFGLPHHYLIIKNSQYQIVYLLPPILKYIIICILLSTSGTKILHLKLRHWELKQVLKILIYHKLKSMELGEVFAMMDLQRTRLMSFANNWGKYFNCFDFFWWYPIFTIFLK